MCAFVDCGMYSIIYCTNYQGSNIMQLAVLKKIGKKSYTFRFEGRNIMECLRDENRLLSFPDVHECGLCKSDLLTLGYRKAQNFDYIFIKCLKCRAELTFGNKKEDRDCYYLRKDDNGNLEWKKYEVKK